MTTTQLTPAQQAILALAVFITVIGLFAAPLLPLSQYPEIAPPTITIANTKTQTTRSQTPTNRCRGGQMSSADMLAFVPSRLP